MARLWLSDETRRLSQGFDAGLCHLPLVCNHCLWCHSMKTYKFRCWNHGDDIENIFGVRISSAETVGALKAAIRAKLSVTFRDVDASDLQLYAIILPDDEHFDNLNRFNVSHETQLDAGMKLSRLMDPTLNDNEFVLIIVKAPPPLNMTLNCSIRGQEIRGAFTVKISRKETLADLRKAIKNELPVTFRDIDADALVLYKVSLLYDQHFEETMKGLTFDREQQLPPQDLLSDVFPDTPLQGHVHILVESPSRTLRRAKRALGDADDLYLVKRAKPRTDSPSNVALSLDHRGIPVKPNQRLSDDHCLQGNDNFDISGLDNAEPGNKSVFREPDIPPVSLLYEGFGQFRDIFRGRKDVPGIEKVPFLQLRSAVDDFAEQMSLLYPSEDHRRFAGLTALNVIFATLTDSDGPSTFTAGSLSESCWSDGHIMGPHRVIYCVTNFKNDSGGFSTIPDVEMTSCFAHSMKGASDVSESVILGWRVPCLGITIIGDCITFYAMIFLGQFRIIRLTPGLSCLRASGDGDDRKALYAAFRAASVLLARIKADAERLVANPPPPIKRSRLLPPISSLCDPQFPDKSIQFEILSFHPTGSREADRRLYIAQTTNSDGTDGKRILVKFTRSYSRELHLFCASRGHAPALLGFQRLPGDLFAIAMEWIPSALPLSRSPYVHKREAWMKQVEELVEAFHAEDLVHGDLRIPNIICDEERVMLIDFDWGGTSGEACYPDVQLHPQLTEGREGSDSDSDLKITKEDDRRVLRMTLDSIRLDL